MTEQTFYEIQLPDGRFLEVADAGIQTGPAIIVHNGTPQAAGLLGLHIQDAIERGFRIISYGRPGYGKSTRHRGRSVASAAKDTADLADALGINRFATWGMSGGGPHALACAALLGDRVVAAATLAGVAPYLVDSLDFMEGMGQDNVEEFGTALKGEKALTTYLEEQAEAFLDASPEGIAEHMHTLLSPPDKAVFTGEFGVQLASSMQKGVDGVFGWLDDDLAFTKDWGFSPSSIQVPLQIWQGSHDLMVPYNHGKWLVKHIPQAEAHLSDEDGHLTLAVTRISDIHTWLGSHF